MQLLCKLAQILGSVAPLRGDWTFAVSTLRTKGSWQVRRRLPIDGQGGRHEITPDLCRHRAPADLAERTVVVAPDPDADDQISREADKKRVPVLLGRARLAERRRGQRGPAPGAVVRGGVKQVEHRNPVAPLVKDGLAMEQ